MSAWQEYFNDVKYGMFWCVNKLSSPSEKRFNGWDLLKTECCSMCTIGLLGRFYSTSRDHNQLIKRSELNRQGII